MTTDWGGFSWEMVVTSKYSQASIVPDLTRAQQAADKKLRAKLKELRI